MCLATYVAIASAFVLCLHAFGNAWYHMWTPGTAAGPSAELSGEWATLYLAALAPGLIVSAFTKNARGRSLWLFIPTGIAPALFFAIVAVNGYYHSSILPDRQEAETRAVVTKVTSFYGQAVPAGSIVAHRGGDVIVELPRGGRFDGLLISGTFTIPGPSDPVRGFGPVTIEQDATVNHIRCASGPGHPLTLDPQYKLDSCYPAPPAKFFDVSCATDRPVEHIVTGADGETPTSLECTLAAPMKSHGIMWPPGTKAWTNGATFTIGPVSPNIAIGGTKLPEAIDLFFSEDSVRVTSDTDVGDPLKIGRCGGYEVTVSRDDSPPGKQPRGVSCGSEGMMDAKMGDLTVGGKQVAW